MKKTRVAGLVLALLVAAMSFGVSAPAFAHFIDYDSVDDCEIRWEDETDYDTPRQWAQARWEARKNRDVYNNWKEDDCVDLAPDAWFTNADLEWKDVTRSDVTWVGQYQNEFGADDILLNKYYMRDFGDCKRKSVAMHELGHAHGLGHSYPGQIMNSYVQNICYLQSHDLADYHALWG
jgi:hypothetical protein